MIGPLPGAQRRAGRGLGLVTRGERDAALEELPAQHQEGAVRPAEADLVARIAEAQPLRHVALPAAQVVLLHDRAVLVDPVDIPHLGDYDDSELTVLLYELKADLAAYLGTWAPNAKVKTLADVIAFNEANKDREMRYFGQELFLKAFELQTAAHDITSVTSAA